MKNIFRYLFITLLATTIVGYSYADKVPVPAGNKSSSGLKATAAGCLPGAGFKYLDINNVRTRINTGGDMWWDFEDADYEIPQGSGKMSMFSASLWIGGIDVNDQLKLAALRYRQGPDFNGGNDYWPGPLTIDGTAAISEETCTQYDKLFSMTREDVDEYLAWWADKNAYPDYTIPKTILDWPAHGDVSMNQSYYLAPFFDYDGDGTYDPTQGDYPYYDISNALCKSAEVTMEGNGILADQVIKGDETLWWVFNDKGNIHTETEGDPIGLEIRGQAFGFSTNDVINNMTFYSYEIINRSTFVLRGTYFSQWVDTDLGFAEDDYVGCDVLRGLGYCYNGQATDGSGQAWAYGDQPPAIGVDFFQGPYLDPDGFDNPSFTAQIEREGTVGPSFDENCSIVSLDGVIMQMEHKVDGQTRIDSFLVLSEAINGVNFGDGIKDNERFGMRRFVYHNNSGVADYMTDPDYAPEYYNFLRGIWKDGTKMEYGGNAHFGQGGAYGPECDFMFPGDSDPCFWGTGGAPPNGDVYWSEVTANNNPYDRRFMQSAGPFTLQPGAVNYITVGIPWARASSGGPWASVELLRVVDDKCQALFDNCFAVVSGPNAPDLTVRELDRELIFYITNRMTNDVGNNFNEAYEEVDPNIKSPDTLGPDEQYDNTYNFEGYQVFQLADADVSVSDIHDPALARQVFQCDVKNGVAQLVNYYYDQSLGGNVPTEEVNGSDEGIVHTFTLTEDAFSGERFVNHKQYYFLAIAYGYNEYITYSDDPGAQQAGIIGLDGQKEPYLAGRKNIKVYTAIPHINVGATAQGSNYGDIPLVKRIQGQGNGGNFMEMTEESIMEILSKPPVDSIFPTDTTWRWTQLGDEDYPIAYQAEYKENAGPVRVKIIDPLNISTADFRLEFDSLYRYRIDNLTGQSNLEGDTASKMIAAWKLVNETTGKEYTSDTTILVDNEQLLLDLGLSINIKQVFNPGTYKIGNNGDDDAVYEALEISNGVLGATIEYADSSNIWLSGVSDTDNPDETNWIRAGVFTDPDSPEFNDWRLSLGSSGTPSGQSFDPEANFEQLLEGTWAPYNLVASSAQVPNGPANGDNNNRSKDNMQMADLASVDVVITPDKSLWTRCPVVEMCPDETLAQGNAEQFDIRAHASVDKDGNYADPTAEPSTNPDDPNYISATGMGWFPGYAINVETGERLNVMFGEDSWLVGENGRDMLWNPSSSTIDYTDIFNPRVLFGGKHYVYIMAHTQGKFSFGGQVDPTYDVPAYDAGRALRYGIPVTTLFKRDFLYSACMWVNIPLSVDGKEWLSDEVKIKLRVAKPYARYYSTTDVDTLDNYNNNYPAYTFSTEALATITDDIAKAESDLDLINVVPNPYYGYSSYETDQLDNRIKITNLPQKCSITIYNVSGTLIRQFNKDESKTSVDWDLKNSAGIPIASGIYLIHVKVPDVGERVLKWFGSIRPVDLNSF